MPILDHRGQPIERHSLQEPQSAHLAQLRSEYENHPSSGLTPPRLARILKDAELGNLTAQHELFADMEEKDGHMFSEMQKRRMALQTLDWDILPPEDATAAEKSLAAYAKEMVCEMEDIEDVIFDATDAIGHGFAALELEWRSVEGQRVPVRATHRPQSWFKVSNQPGADRNELRLRDNSADGEALWSFGWILHTHKSRSGYISRSGLFRVLAWPFIFKNYAIRDLAEFLEIYGLPLRLGKYNPAATEKDKATLMRAVVGIGHDAAAIIPEGMAIDFLAAAQGDNKSFDAMIGLMERIQSKAILGGTLTSGEGTHGSQALGNVHNEVRHDLMEADARQIGVTLTRQLIYPTLAVNKGVSGLRRCPRLVFDTQEPEDVQVYAQSIPRLVGMGMRIKRSWAHDKLKIPEAAEGEDILVLPRPEQTLKPEDRPEPEAKAQPAAAQLRTARLRAEAPQVGAEPDELDRLSAEMLCEWLDGMGELQDAVDQALASAASYEDFAAALETGLAGIEPQRLVELMARGNFAARMWGQVNAPKRPADSGG